MKTAFLIFLLVHGLIHLLGAAKGLQLADVSQLKQPVARRAGFAWSASAFLFVVSGLLFVAGSRSWWIPATIAVICSQVVIVQSWADAKFGTLPNAIILVPIAVAFLNWLPSSYINIYRSEVTKRLVTPAGTAILREADIAGLPLPVQKYLRFGGAVGKPKVHNFRAVFGGSMKRSLTSDWISISSQQYDFFNDPTRLFYIESDLYGIPFDGLHVYAGDSATMRIKVASAFPIVHARGEKMKQGETVTLFNDMCLLAPATLIDTSIRWETLDSLHVRGMFTNRGTTIAALLSFNERGELVNFTSNDRFLSSDGITYTSYPWSTPTSDYREYDGRRVASFGQAIWQTPEGAYAYARFTLLDIEYNCTELR